MRIHRLEFTGIGPFRDRQEIDFDRLTASGVFLIDGPTGAGKTTIIDAIVFALYGDVSGREADDSRLRSAYALPTEPSEVICEFSVGDRRQWVRRTPRYMRPKVKGNGLTAEPATQLLREFDREGSLRVELTHASEIGAHISSLLGMSAQQFRQLVVLPQGEFAELLRMKPAERFTALGPLLGDEFYRALQDEIELRGAAARARRISVDEAVHDVEQQFIGALGDLDLAEVGEAAEAFADESLTSQVRLGAAGVIAAWVSIREQGLAGELKVLEQEFDSMRLRMERAAEFSAALAVLADAEQLHSVSLRRLDESHRSLTSREASDLVAQLQQRKGRLEPWVGWEASADARMHERMRLDHEVDQAVADLEEGQTLVLSLPDRRASLQRTLTAVDLLAATAQQHRKEVEELSGLATRASERDAIERHLLDKSARQSSAHERSLEADRELGRRSAELEELLMQQLHERAAVLATALIQGQPCPVCGASEHPHPAQETLEFVSDEELGRRRDELESLREVARQARKVLDEANREVQALLAEVLPLRGAMGVRDAAAIGQELTDAQDGLANALSAAQQRSEITDELRHFDEQETLLRDRLQTAASDLALKRAALEQHDAGTASARRELAEILGPSMSATRLSSETDELIRDLVAFAGASEALAVAQRAVPELVDVVDGQAWVLQVAEDHELAQRRLSHGQHLHGQFKHVASGIRRPHELLRRCVQEQQLAYEQTTEAIALADAVSAARGSINKRRMTLQSYAVQRRFESVLEAASLHLARMSAGKYTLTLDDQAHGNAQGGLGIKVSDAWTGQDRDPRSLSGGETFYTALSLALGLADVVRDEAGGAQLETLFVDEGFGSLDQEALELVLEQLDALRSGGRVVGVVSHVTEMKEWVNERVDVSVRADRTSTLRVVT